MPQKSPLPSKNHEFLDQNYSSRVKHDLTIFPTTKNTNFKGQTFLTKIWKTFTRIRNRLSRWTLNSSTYSRRKRSCPTWTPLLLPTKRNHQTYLSIKFSALLPQTASLKASNPSLLQANRAPPLSFWSRDDELCKNQQPANHCLFTACSLTSPQKSYYQTYCKKTSSNPSSNLYCSMFSSMSKPYR